MMIWTAGVKMNESRQWLTTLTLYLLILIAGCAKPHRRSMASQQTLPLSKGGWRPVINQNSGLLFGYNTAPLHAPQYKIPVPVMDYPTSQRPHPTRDAGKLSSIAQAYRPTTLRTVSSPPLPAASQPINSYLNPFSLPNNLAHYKFVQNFPLDNVVIRNPHNPFAARPMFKYPNKFKQQFSNQYQQLMTVQPIQFGQYQTMKPLDLYGKPLENFGKPLKQQGNTEIYKTEVFKLQDSDTAPAINQQVKTAQQSLPAQKVPSSPYPQFTFSEQVLPANIFGSFGSFGGQSVKGGSQLYPAKTTYLPPSPSKQTLFNSFSFAPNFKTTPQFATTTPKLQTTLNHVNTVHFGTTLTWNDYKHFPTQATKVTVSPVKVDPNANKGTFKPSPQDPFIKHFNAQEYKVSTYNPTVQTTTFSYSNFHPAEYTPVEHSQHQQNSQIHNYNNQQNSQLDNYNNQQNSQLDNYNNKKKSQLNNYNNQQDSQSNNYNNQQKQNLNNDSKKHKIKDSVPAGVNHQTGQQYASPPKISQQEGTQNSPPYHATYEVTENYNDDGVTHSTLATWPVTPETYKSTENSVTKPEYYDYSKATTLPYPEEFAIITEAQNNEGYDNSLSYDRPVESQSRRPSSDEFEPIGKHKLKEYYYKVSTPTYEDHGGRRTKKPSEKRTQEVTQSSVSKDNDEVTLNALPTLPPNQHFKRPNAPEPIDKDKIRKRNKIRRRRPQGGNNRDSSTRKYTSSTTESYTTEENHTIRPRVRPNQSKHSGVTTPTISTDQTTSAVPTVSPTIPTIIKKKLVNRRPLTSTDRVETTASGNRDYESNKESPIMKISAAARVHPKPSTTPYEYKDQTPDYSHKQDEKDTPTSDIAVSLNDFKTTKAEAQKAFSFHRYLKPIEPKPENGKETTTENSSEESNEITTTPKIETTQSSVKILRPRLKNKYDRPRFSVKDYRNRLSSTTSTEKPAEASSVPKIRLPHRRLPNGNGDNKVSESENTTERKKFTPKEQRQSANRTETESEKESYSVRPIRMRLTTAEPEATTQKISSRIRNGSRRPRPTEETTEPTSRRPLRKKIKDSDLGESVQDIAVETTATTRGETTTSERTRSESAIMKIADKKQHDRIEHLFEHSKRVSDLTLAASKDYNNPGIFKSVAPSSRRIPNYFTIATDDPILPIEAFFPQINNQKKES